MVKTKTSTVKHGAKEYIILDDMTTNGGGFENFPVFIPPDLTSSSYTILTEDSVYTKMTKAKAKKKSVSKEKEFKITKVTKTPKTIKKDLKEVKRVGKIFKMSDFKFPSVKRVNTQLARKTLQTDLGADILEDIGGLKI